MTTHHLVRRTIWTLALGALAFPGISSAQGAIHGHILDAETGAAVELSSVQIFDADGRFVVAVSADALGYYYAGNLPLATYYVRSFNFSGYIDEFYDGLTCVPECDVMSATPVTTNPVSASRVDFTLDGRRIRGRIRLVPDVSCVDASARIYDESYSFVTESSTDCSGNYSSDPLPPGTYYVGTENPGYWMEALYESSPCNGGTCNLSEATPVVLPAGESVGGIDFELTAGGKIHGHIGTWLGTGLTNVEVKVYNSLHELVAVQTSDAAAYYEFEPFSPGTYYIRTETDDESYFVDEVYASVQCVGFCDLRKGTPVEVTAFNSEGINFELSAGGKISGRIADAVTGDVSFSPSILLYDEAGDYAAEIRQDGSSYLTPPLPFGKYYLRTSNYYGYLNELYNDVPCYSATGCDVTTGTVVTVNAWETTEGIDFDLDRGGEIFGAITDAVTGWPIDQVGVLIYDENGNGFTYGWVESMVLGTYRSAAGLPTGKYYVRSINFSGYADELYDDLPYDESTDVTSGTPVYVTAGAATVGINFALEEAPLFADGFESGDLSAWSSSIGELP